MSQVLPIKHRIKKTVRLNETDAAGVMFFAQVYDDAHQCYEDFLEQSGLSISQILKQGEYILPIAHSSAKHLQPILLGQHLEIQLNITKVSLHSFVIEYEFINTSNNAMVAQVQSVHVCVSRQKQLKMELPLALKNILSRNIKQ